MNKSYIILIFIFVLTLSCDEYVDILPEGENTENYFNTPSDYENAVIGAYDMLGTTYFSNIVGEIASDNSLCGGENSTDVLDWQQIDDMTHNANNSELRKYWQYMYAGISRTNYIMEFQNNLDFEGKELLIGETRFLRAYYYFELVKFFGGVPLYIDKRVTIDETAEIDRSSIEDCYAQIESDLQYAADNLPWIQNEPGRATKGAALSLLGKAYLYQEKFTEAKDVLDPVIGSGHYDLVADYNDIFTLNNENNEESIFEIQYIGTEGAGFGCFQCAEGNIAVGFMGPRFSGGDYNPYADGFSFNVPVQSLYDFYDAGDVRRDATIFDIDEFVATHTDVTYNIGYEHTGYFNKKYIPYSEGNAPDPHLTHSNNYRAIRLADVLLMAAEAYNRGNLGDGMAQTYVNRVRDRVGLPNITSTGSTLTQDIWDERRRELAGEGHRFFDQVRTGETFTIDGFTAGKNELFPIPLIEMQLTGNFWSQNPGY